VDVGIDLLPDLDDLAAGRDEEGIAGGVLHISVGHNGDTVCVDDFVVRVGEELEAEGVFGAPCFVVFHGVEADAEDDCVQSVILCHIALEVVGLDGAALGLVLGVEVENDPLALEVGEADHLVFLRRQGKVGRRRSGLYCVCGGRCMGLEAEAARCCDADDYCYPNCFTHGGTPYVCLFE